MSVWWVSVSTWASDWKSVHPAVGSPSHWNKKTNNGNCSLTIQISQAFTQIFWVAAMTFDVFVWPRLTLATPFACHYCLWTGAAGGVFIGWCWMDSCCVWLLTRGLITETLPVSSCRPPLWPTITLQMWAKSQMMIKAECRWSAHTLCVLMDGSSYKQIQSIDLVVCYVLLCCRSDPKQSSRLRKSKLCQIWLQSLDFWQIILDAITFLFKDLSLLLVVSNAQYIGLSLLLLISHLYTWVDRSSSNPLSIPQTPPTFSRVLRARQLWKQCGICAAGRETHSLLYLPILTRFSRDIRGNKRCDIPAFRCSKLHPITLMQDSFWIEGNGKHFGWLSYV